MQIDRDSPSVGRPIGSTDLHVAIGRCGNFNDGLCRSAVDRIADFPCDLLASLTRQNCDRDIARCCSGCTVRSRSRNVELKRRSIHAIAEFEGRSIRDSAWRVENQPARFGQPIIGVIRSPKRRWWKRIQTQRIAGGRPVVSRFSNFELVCTTLDFINRFARNSRTTCQLITTCRTEGRGRRWRGTDDFFASFRKPDDNIVNVNAARFVALRS